MFPRGCSPHTQACATEPETGGFRCRAQGNNCIAYWWPPAPKPQTVVISEPTSTYEVRGGDTLSVVAQAFNTSVAKIKKMNGLKSDNLRIGQKLIVPQVQ